MSQENVEIVKEFTRRFGARQGVSREYFDPEIVWDVSASGLKDSKVIRFRLFESREQALEAAGLSE